jgi:hypothetical protein
MRQDLFWIIPLLLLPSLFMISFGLIRIFKKDWVWWMTELYLKDVNPQRTPEWENGLALGGYILIAAGVGLVLYVLSQIPRLMNTG